MNISINRLHFPVTTLGYGNRIGIWFQGCSIHCPGCISLDTWEFDRGIIEIEELQKSLKRWLHCSDGITISGGEPFDQFEQLHSLLQWFYQNSSGDILVFSGYPIESLEPQIEEIRGLVDVLVTDPYNSAASQLLPLRGSDNQRLHCLTQRGHERYAQLDKVSGALSQKELDVFFDENETAWIAGIPKKGDMNKIERLLLSMGVTGRTSQSRINRLT